MRAETPNAIDCEVPIPMQTDTPSSASHGNDFSELLRMENYSHSIVPGGLEVMS